MSEETLQHEGTLDSMNKGPSGTKQNGDPWQIWKYEIGGKVFSSFDGPKKLKLIMQDYYIVAYVEKENAKHPESPHKNITNVTPGVKPEITEEEVKEGPGLVEEPEKPKAIDSEEERWDKINAVKDKKIMFGQVLNLTMGWIMNERRIEQSPKVTLDTHFDKMFDHIWKLATEKRKEKLE